MRRMSRTSRDRCTRARRAISSGQRLATELLDELALDVHDLVELLDHVDRDADRAALVRDRARHRLADPPRRVGRELVAAAVVELLDRADQAERALLDQVQERQAAAEVALGDRDDEAQVGLDHLLLGDQVAALDPLGQRDLALGGEQLYAADRAQVEPQRVQARLDREVDLRLARGVGRLRSCRPPAGSKRPPSDVAGLPSAPTTSIPCASRYACSSATCSLVTSTSSSAVAICSNGQEPPLLTFGDQRTKLVDLRDRRFVREQCLCLRCPTLILRDDDLSSALRRSPREPLLPCLCRVETFPLSRFEPRWAGLESSSVLRRRSALCAVPAL